MNNNNHFSIINYIKSKLEKNISVGSEEFVTVILNRDNNGEPYIDINYKDEYGEEAGLTKNFNKLYNLYDCASNYSDTYNNNSIVSVIYDTTSEKFNLIKVRNGNYIGKKYMVDYDGVIFVGYIIENKKMSMEQKIKILYKEVIENIMDSVYRNDYEDNFIFMAGDQILNNICMICDFKDGNMTNDDLEGTSRGNIETIEEVFQIKLSYINKQKTLK